MDSAMHSRQPLGNVLLRKDKGPIPQQKVSKHTRAMTTGKRQWRLEQGEQRQQGKKAMAIRMMTAMTMWRKKMTAIDK
jgi:hypothetical protein